MLCNAMFISAASLNAALRFFVSQMSNYIVCDLYFCLLQMSFYGIDIWRRFENLTQVSAFSRWPLKMPAQQKKLALNFIRKCNGCCMLRSSDIGRCKARAADTWTITNTFQPQDVGDEGTSKKLGGCRRYEDDINVSWEERSGGRIARVERFVYETSRFLSRNSTTSALGHILKGSSNF